MVLDGFLPKPGADLSLTSSSTSDKTFIFINKRPVQQKDILKVKRIQIVCFLFLSVIYHVSSPQLLRQHHSAQYPDDAARHRFPVLLLNITVCPSSLDVNVTPDKTQVLLHNKVPEAPAQLIGFRFLRSDFLFLRV